MRVVLAPDKFRGSLSAAQAADAMAVAVERRGWDAVRVPMSDGGEGFLHVLGGPNRTTTVTGPLGDPVEAKWRFVRRRAVLEMAEAAGLEIAGGAEANDPLSADTTGVGELIGAALDAGALHARAIRFDDRARVLDYRMTSQCASGSGQFLENIARYLGVTLDEVGTLSVRGEQPEKVSGICAVLAETDVINMVSRGITTPNILRGIHESMSAGFAKLLKNSKAQGVILLTGGLAADVGIVACLKQALKKQAHEKGGEALAVEVRTHPDSVYAGALGAALWGAYRVEKLQRLGGEPLAALPL